MKLSNQQVSKIINRLLNRITKELENANINDCAEEFLEKYDISEVEEEIYINPRTCKIIVMGALSGKVKDFKLAAKKIGIDPERIEFVGYQECKRFNVARLENSNIYSDIIIGPMPHKVEGMGDVSSLLAAIKKEPSKYPKLLECRENSNEFYLKITVGNFKKCLGNSRYFELCQC